MTEKEIQALIEKYISGQCLPEEQEFLERWYAEELKQRTSEINRDNLPEVKDEIWGRIIDERPEVTGRRIAWPVWAGVAAVLLIGFFAIQQSQRATDTNPHDEKTAAQPLEVTPGGNKAMLTMGNGRQFILTDAEDGVIDETEGLIVRKQEDGLISFEIVDQSSNVALVNNTVETPKGGIYQVVLPDGSKAWLNSASSITFPSSFSKEERKVAIKGEIYFEIERDESRPFRVETLHQQIEVLGTKFNINAYEDEPFVRTSLLAGSVRVKGAEQEHVLKPGFEMSTSKEGHDSIDKADTEAIMAWKEGVFQFDRVELEVLMRQLARWYDVEVIYQGKSPQDEFVGKIKRNEDIREVLEILKYGNIDVSLDGRKLMVGTNK